MFEIAKELLGELDAGRSLTLVTVTRVDGSAPRALGSTMALTETGAVIGSISGGCVEGDSIELARMVQDSTIPRAASFGFDDETAFRSGLSCGGKLTVLAYPLTPENRPAYRALRAVTDGEPTELAIVIGKPGETPAEDGVLLDAQIPSGAGRVVELSAPRPPRTVRTRAVVAGEEVDVLRYVHSDSPRMIVIGAVDFSASLTVAAKTLGYRVSVVDPRALFATRERFPAADEVVVAWPDEYLAHTKVDEQSVIAVLTHSDRFDIPALKLALRLPVAYVGAMGSRSTHTRRIALLQESGLSEEEISRLHSPIGLDLGASTPEETAISILAEVLAVRASRSAAPLRSISGSIHPRAKPD